MRKNFLYVRASGVCPYVQKGLWRGTGGLGRLVGHLGNEAVCKSSEVIIALLLTVNSFVVTTTLSNHSLLQCWS